MMLTITYKRHCQYHNHLLTIKNEIFMENVEHYNRFISTLLSTTHTNKKNVVT